MAAGSIKAVSYERDFALTMGVKQCITQSRFLNETTRWMVMGRIGQQLLLLNSSDSFIIRLLDETGLSVVGTVISQDMNELPQFKKPLCRQLEDQGQALVEICREPCNEQLFVCHLTPTRMAFQS